jgi:hypothetical protein
VVLSEETIPFPPARKITLGIIFIFFGILKCYQEIAQKIVALFFFLDDICKREDPRPLFINLTKIGDGYI